MGKCAKAKKAKKEKKSKKPKFECEKCGTMAPEKKQVCKPSKLSKKK